MGFSLWDGLEMSDSLLAIKVSNRESFLYIESAVISVKNGGISVSRSNPATGNKQESTIPIALVNCAMLGPGVRISSAALNLMGENGCNVVTVGRGSVKTYSSMISTVSSSRVIEKQAAIIGDTNERLAASKRLYAMRFSGDISHVEDIETLRGMEGFRMKHLYQENAKRFKILGWQRQTEVGWDTLDPVNRALSMGNAALYGLVSACIVGLGGSPSLGIVHTGKRLSFTYDIADLYKEETTIPIAFSLHGSQAPEREIRTRLREDLGTLKLVPRIVNDIFTALGMRHDSVKQDIVSLWTPEGNIQGGVNYWEAADVGNVLTKLST